MLIPKEDRMSLIDQISRAKDAPTPASPDDNPYVPRPVTWRTGPQPGY